MGETNADWFISSSASSGIEVGMMGSELGPTTDVVSEFVSATSLVVSLPPLDFRRFTTRVFFFREFRGRPVPKARPDAEGKLDKDGREAGSEIWDACGEGCCDAFSGDVCGSRGEG